MEQFLNIVTLMQICKKPSLFGTDAPQANQEKGVSVFSKLKIALLRSTHIILLTVSWTLYWLNYFCQGSILDWCTGSNRNSKLQVYWIPATHLRFLHAVFATLFSLSGCLHCVPFFKVQGSQWRMHFCQLKKLTFQCEQILLY